MRLLWLKTELLHPVDKGGRIRTYSMLKELRREHHITYLTLDDGSSADDARERALEYCHDLICVPHRTRMKFSSGFYVDLARNLATPLPYFVQKYASLEMRSEISNLAVSDDFDVLVCDFLMPSVNVPQNLGCPTILFEHNVEAIIWRRHYEVQHNPLKKAYLYTQWRKAFRYERATCRRFDRVVTVSREDSDRICNDYGIRTVRDIPTGVDTAFFLPSGAERRGPRNLIFTGSMDWLPNNDAILYFSRYILPIIKRSIPEVTLTVVGRNPYRAVVDLAKRDPSIVVTGRVDDVRPFMERASAYVVPIRVGGGTRLKIFEAMAMEMPVVSTTIGAEGLPVRSGQEILLADDPQTFAAAVVRILNDEAFAHQLGRRAADFVRGKFGWNEAARLFAEICQDAGRLKVDFNQRADAD